MGISDRKRFANLSEQERYEEMCVKMGNAPVYNNNVGQAIGTAPQGPAAPVMNVPVINQTSSSDNKCPSCGATLTFDPKTGGLVCNFCGNTVQLNSAPAEPGTGYTFDDFINNSAHRLTDSSIKLIVCGTCGGHFTADQRSISGLCPFCGSNSITVSNNDMGLLEPTGVIPFQVDKERAQRIFQEWISKRRFAPTDLIKNARATDLVGVYVPYWVFDCDTRADYKGRFGRTYGSGDDQRTVYHKGSGHCDLPVKNLTLVASSRLEKDAFWKSISVFNFDYMKKYDPNLLAGFWSESYSVDGQTAWQNAGGKIYGMVRNRIMKMETADCVDWIEMQPEAYNIRAKYVLAPVWVTSFKYNNAIYQVILNGQTGVVAGTWPKSLKRLFTIIGIVAGGLFASRVIFLLLSWLIEFLRGMGG